MDAIVEQWRRERPELDPSAKEVTGRIIRLAGLFQQAYASAFEPLGVNEGDYGVLAALRPNTFIDRVAMTIAVLGQALPTFWLGLLLIILFGLILRWLPISGSDTWLHYILPSFVLGYYSTPAVMRLTRSGMLEVLASDYIRTAYAKGLTHGTVLFKHALRNAAIPVVALASVQFGHMLSGSVVIETVFAMQGVGQLAWQSISRQDFPVVQAVLLLVSMFYVWLTFASDLINAWLDPRIRGN